MGEIFLHKSYEGQRKISLPILEIPGNQTHYFAYDSVRKNRWKDCIALEQMKSSYFVCKRENSSLFRRWFSTEVKHYFPDIFLKGQLEKTMICIHSKMNKSCGFNSGWKYVRDSKQIEKNNLSGMILRPTSNGNQRNSVKKRKHILNPLCWSPSKHDEGNKISDATSFATTNHIDTSVTMTEHFPFNCMVITNNFGLH